jgi:UDP-glucose 4-epimerase
MQRRQGGAQVVNVLVTGGAGFIGSHLCEALVARGDSVTVLDDLSTGRFENIEHIAGLTCIVDSTLSRKIVRETVREADVVYHLAATVGVQLVLREPIRTILNNVRGTEILVEETCRYRRRLLITSSSEVYGKGRGKVFREDDDRVLGPTTLTRWCYAESKAIDEALALAYWREKRHPVIIARLFNTVGPRQSGGYGTVLPRFIEQALRNEPLTVYGDGRQTRCFAYVGDVVSALVALMDHTDLCGDVYNVGSSESVTIEELARRVIRRTRSRSRILYVPYTQAYGLGFEDVRHRAPNLAKIRRAIGYRPTTLLDEIIDFVIADLRQRLAGSPQ